MSELLGLEFWSKKDLVAEVERLKADNVTKADLITLLTREGERSLDTIQRLTAELASVQTIKRC